MLRDQLSAVTQALGGKRPLLANMVEGGQTPLASAGELEAIGFSLAIFPGAVVRTLAHTAQEFYATLRRDGTTDAFRNRMFDFDALNALIGTPQMRADGRHYESFDPGRKDKP